jgi:hypothetical protein
MPMFTTDVDARHYLKSQRIMALAAVIESLKGANMCNTKDEDIRIAAMHELLDALKH